MKSQIALAVAVLVIVSMFAGSRAVVKQGINNTGIKEVQGKEINFNQDNESVGCEIIRKVSGSKDSHANIIYPQVSGYKGQLLNVKNICFLHRHKKPI